MEWHWDGHKSFPNDELRSSWGRSIAEALCERAGWCFRLFLFATEPRYHRTMFVFPLQLADGASSMNPEPRSNVTDLRAFWGRVRTTFAKWPMTRDVVLFTAEADLAAMKSKSVVRRLWAMKTLLKMAAWTLSRTVSQRNCLTKRSFKTAKAIGQRLAALPDAPCTAGRCECVLPLEVLPRISHTIALRSPKSKK